MRTPEQLTRELAEAGADFARFGLPSWMAVVAVTPDEAAAWLEWTERHAPGSPLSTLLQARRMRDTQDRRASLLRWCHVSGGRARHAFLEGSDVPLCGVRPVRSSTGAASLWIGGGGGPRRRHGACDRGLRRLAAEGVVPWGLTL